MKLECGARAAAALIGLSASTMGCAARLAPAAAAPASLGAHAVGVTRVEVPDPEGFRRLTVEVWYPAAAPADGPPVVYEIEALGLVAARIGSIASAHRDVPPLRSEGPRPLVLFSHGRGSTRFANASLSEVLASHGYVVAAPDHPGHTMEDELAGIGDVERSESAFDRPRDLSRVIDDLAARSSRADSAFADLVDLSRVGVAGHSFGALAALGLTGAGFDAARQRQECTIAHDDWRCAAVSVFGAEPYRYRDARVKAALLISPAGFDLYRADGVAQVDAPTLVVGAHLDAENPFDAFARPTFDALTSPRYLLDLPQAGHLTATNVCDVIDSIGFVAKAFGGRGARDGCGGAYSPRDALEDVASAALPFLDLYLNGESEAAEPLRVAIESAGRGPRAIAAAGGAGRGAAR